MRPLRQLPQLPQIFANRSNSRGFPAIYVRILHLGRIAALQPFRDFFVAKPPLAAEFDSGDLLALRPQTNGASRDTQPAGNGRGGEKGFCDQHFLHRIPVDRKNHILLEEASSRRGNAPARRDTWCSR